MAQDAPFSLLPASAPGNAVPKLSMPNPHKKKPSISRAVSPHHDRKSAVESIVIELENIPIPPIPAHMRTQHAVITPVQEIGQAVTTDSARETAKSLVPKQGSPRSRMQQSSPEPRSMASGSTLVQSSPETGKGSSRTSPVVPIRSMFPTYNPNVPLHQQSYHPQIYPSRQSSLQRMPVSRDDYRKSLVVPPTTRTAPSSVINFPMDTLSVRGPRYSSQKDLEKLWSATHGMEPDPSVRSFNLELARISEASFVFGADPACPFYTMLTYDTNEIAMSKTCPAKRSINTDIVLCSLEAMSRRLPPNDGLVTFIFPKLAATLAIKQSEELARVHNLAPTHRDEVQAAAVQRAANQEACNLRWNPRYQRYELDHPGIGRNARDPNFAFSPTSPQGIEKPVVHITVSSHALLSSPQSAVPPVILVTVPPSIASPTQSIAAGIRASTIAESDIDNALASLDFGTQTLHINADRILSTIPSLFAIDAIVSAMMAVAISDEATNTVMANMELWSPRPKAPLSIFGGSTRTYSGSVFYATLAEREEAEQEVQLMKQIHDKDVRGDRPKKSWFGGTGEKKQKNKKTQIVVTEFDLEKLGHYQSGDRQGEELPGITRSMVSAVVLLLRVFVWMLTAFVQLLVWVMVNATRAVTSEKF